MALPQRLGDEGPRDPGTWLDDLGPRPSVPDLTVVLPTVGRDVVRRAVASIARGTHWPSRLIVVDQSSGEAVARLAENLNRIGIPTDHLVAPLRGVAAARNRGIERVTTRWFVITDDDHDVTDDWLVRMHLHLGARPGTVVTGMVAPAAPGVPSSTTDETPAVHERPLLARDPLFAGNMGTSMDVVHEVGPFDERGPLEGAEDNDWGYRAIRLGVPIVYAPDVKVVHMDWRDARGIERTYRRYARAQGAFYGKHLRRGDPFIALRALRDLARGPWLIARAMATRNDDLMMLGRSELAGILPGILAGFRLQGPPVIG
jgi:glycosyltransferase involved in cell wall biosynthesis